MTELEQRQSEWTSRKTLVYKGSSMFPTFRELDVLSYRKDRSLRAGDVIAFLSPSHGHITVHRIVRIRAEEYITQGDNSSSPDSDPVQPDHVLGRIDSFNRDGVVLKVSGGKPGFAYAKGCHVLRRLRPTIVALVGLVYRRLMLR